MSLEIMPGLAITESEIEVSYILASGPGGQNVNKVATAAQLRFDARNSPALTSRIRTRLREIAGSRMTKDGVVVITAQRYRSQIRNREDAVDRLMEMLREAAERPVRRIATRPSLGEKRRRMEGKAHRAKIKQGRSGGWD